MRTAQNVAVELVVSDAEATALDPAGVERRLPAFRTGSEWHVRYASPLVGQHHVEDQVVDVEPYTGDNDLLAHGPVRVSPGETKLVHADRTPFLWLADTWWLAFVKRFTDTDFAELADRRARQGFSVVQLVAGLYPETPPLGEPSAGDHGHPWTPGFESINDAWWEAADRRIQGLVDCGIVPCVFGAWGSVAETAGVEVMKEHWRTIVARWAALPVVWCIAGEAILPRDIKAPAPVQQAVSERLREIWEEVAGYVREIDGHGRPMSVHPSPGDGSYCSSDVFRDPALIDFEMIQTGHTNLQTAETSLAVLERTRARAVGKPTLNTEVCYEGIMGASWHDVQRLVFWTHMLRGAAGHSYGAQGLWAFNESGAEGIGGYWGPLGWRDATQLPGADHLGLARSILMQFDWAAFEPHPEWIDPSPTAETPILPHAAGIPGEIRVIYFPSPAAMPAQELHGFLWLWEVRLRDLEAGEWVAQFVDPRTGEWLPERRTRLDKPGSWLFRSSEDSAAPTFEDWLLVVRRA